MSGFVPPLGEGWRPLPLHRLSRRYASAIAALLLGGPPPAGANNWSHYLSNIPVFDRASNVSVGLLAKRATPEWAPVEDQVGVGLGYDYTVADVPVSFCTGLSLVAGEGSTGGADVGVRSVEVDLGVRRIWYGFPTVWPYLSAGLVATSVWAERTIAGNTESESAFGFGGWVGGGFYYRLAKSLTAGFDLRWSRSEVRLFDESANAGGWQARVFLGYRWEQR